jgi:hypothetical protein
MLKMLLDENLSDEIAHQIKLRRAEIPIDSVHEWKDGILRGQPDEELLRAIAQDSWTLVTYDINTIPPLLVQLAEEGYVHGGVIFISRATIRSNEFGRLVRALTECYDAEQEADWRDRVYFLPAPHGD